jgi:hypothetical protein
MKIISDSKQCAKCSLAEKAKEIKTRQSRAGPTTWKRFFATEKIVFDTETGIGTHQLDLFYREFCELRCLPYIPFETNDDLVSFINSLHRGRVALYGTVIMGICSATVKRTKKRKAQEQISKPSFRGTAQHSALKRMHSFLSRHAKSDGPLNTDQLKSLFETVLPKSIHLDS